MARAFFGLLVLIISTGAYGAVDLPALTVTTDDSGNTNYSVSIQILAVMTVITLIPSLVIMLTAFTRIVIVFAILRQAIGMQQTPSNQILVGIALFLTLFVMTPVFETVNETAIQPYLAETLPAEQAVQVASGPFREFMFSQTRENDLDLFMRLSKHVDVDRAEDVDFFVLVPAFMTSELKTAFQIGFLVFIPFLVIDLVVSSVLMSMGMMMLSPMLISLPFKIMLFVMVDGWALVLGTLAKSFYT